MKTKKPKKTGSSFNEAVARIQGPKLITRFDNCCPTCGHGVGWSTLAERFDGQSLDVNESQEVKVICPKCDGVMLVTLLIDFSTKQVNW